MRRGRYKISAVSKLKAFDFGALKFRFLTGDKAFGGTSVVHETLPPRSRLPCIYHEKTDELVLVLKGSLHAELDGRRFVLKPGDIAHLPAGTRHMFSTRGRSAEALSIFSPCMTINDLDVVPVEPK